MSWKPEKNEWVWHNRFNEPLLVLNPEIDKCGQIFVVDEAKHQFWATFDHIEKMDIPKAPRRAKE